MKRDKLFQIILYVVVGIYYSHMIVSCTEKERETGSIQETSTEPVERVPERPSSIPDREVRERHDSICRELNRKGIVQSVTVEHNARTISEAYDEGFDVGREDGEEDGMNNDPEFSYDDSCPYKGKMLIAYKRGYRDGYDEGLADGLEEYNLTKEPWEEETDW